KRIAKATFEKDKIARIVPVPNDPTTVIIETFAPGESSLRVADVDGKAEPYHLCVRTPSIVLTEGEKKRLQMSKKQAIRHVANVNDNAIKLLPVKNDMTNIELDAMAVGLSDLALTDVDNKTETFIIGVKPKK